MLSSSFILTALLIIAPALTPDFSITLSFHPEPFYHLEWFITLERAGTKASIASNKMKYARKKRTVPMDEYARLVKRLTSLGMWNCRDYYTHGNYYLLTIVDRNYRHQCKIEYTPSMSGVNKHEEMIRLLMNTADNYLK